LNTDLQEVIRERYSVRFYRQDPIAEETQAALMTSLATLQRGPLGSKTRFSLVAATAEDRAALRGLGTYGFIKNPTGFIIGAVETADHALEDFGYMMEKAVLEATALGLGTCWLGGSFTQSSFARKIGKLADEIIPAVAAAGYTLASDVRARDLLRRAARAETRLPWETLFFDGSWREPLTIPCAVQAGGYAQALAMVRLAPSASNKQPWRIVKDGARWHFYCQRTPGYGQGSLYFTLLRLADLQRLDIGIAMCHFALTAQQLGLPGSWTTSDPGLESVNERTLYIATWEAESR
jgi:nitroreductase